MTAAPLPPASRSYAELRSLGFSRTEIGRQLADGQVVRVRRGRYALGTVGDDYLRAARLGGRLDCLSLLHALGVFVFAVGRLHVQLDRAASRVPALSANVARHWRATRAAAGDLGADIIEALAQSCRCQPPRRAIATLDSALHLGLIDEVGLAQVFERLPERFGVLRRHLDARSEAGTESLVRLMLRALGCIVDVQVKIPGVGRVDFVVDEWLIVECDSRAHHSKAEDQLRDRERDVAAAAQGYVTLRLLAEHILFHPERVLAALRGALTLRPTR